MQARLNALIATNVRWLGQALRLLETLDDATYAESRTGAHLRHILDFYQCFLNGLESSHIDYDARRRDASIERSRETAAMAIRSIVYALETRSDVRQERIVWVRMEDVEGSGVPETFIESSLSRELQALSSHTVHHFALIAVTLRAHGVQMDLDFGMAPSTLRYLASQTAEAA